MFFRYFFKISLVILGALLVPVTFAAAQETPAASPAASPSPTPAPKMQIGTSRKGKRTSGVLLTPENETSAPAVKPDQAANDDDRAEQPAAGSLSPGKNAVQIESERLAGEAALERERHQAAAQADEKSRLEFAKREAELQSQIDSERQEKEKAQANQAAELEKMRDVSEAEKKKIADDAEVEKQRLADQTAADKKQRDSEMLEMQRRTDELKEANARQIAEAQKLADDEKTKREAAELAAAAAQQKAAEIEKQRLEAEKVAADKTLADNAEKAKLRAGLIELTAKRLNFINPADASALVPDAALSAQAVEAALGKAVAANPRLNKRLTFCDKDFVGAPLNIMISANPTMGGLLNALSDTFNLNFLPDPEILELPIAGDVKDVPWNYVLLQQLRFNDLNYQCENGAIAILKRSKLQTIQDNQRKSEPIITDSIKLKYLQPAVAGTVNVAGRGAPGANVLDSLEQALNVIVRAGGDNRGAVSRIPATNEFIISATEDQWLRIRKIIAKADKPSYQVVIYASIVTLNENKLQDTGGSISAVGGTGNLGLLGGLSTFGGASAGGTSSSTGSGSGGSSNLPGSLNPGGVRSLGDGFGTAPTGGSTFGVSNIFGTIQLSAQLNLLQQRGVVKIDNRPSIVVLDGQTADLQIGRQVSIPIQSIGTLGGGNGQLEVLNAGNTLNASPIVITDENDQPVAVSMNIRVESNDVDTTVVSQGVPSIIRRSTQTSLMLNTNQTAVIGGFSTDSETNSQSHTPGLHKLPLVGGLFKHKISAKNSDRLYFAIRVAVISQGQILTTLPINIDTSPRLPNPDNDFFKPYNQPVTPPVNVPAAADKP